VSYALRASFSILRTVSMSPPRPTSKSGWRRDLCAMQCASPHNTFSIPLCLPLTASNSSHLLFLTTDKHGLMLPAFFFFKPPLFQTCRRQTSMCIVLPRGQPIKRFSASLFSLNPLLLGFPTPTQAQPHFFSFHLADA